jgi:long-subunit acyl-CoA synthetase (AMP-forming)
MTGHPFETDLDKNAANYVPLSPISFLARTAAVFPTRASVIHGEQRFTWSQTQARCHQLASALAKHGIGKGDTVSVMAPNVPPSFEATFGVPMTGAVLNALNTRLDAATVAFILNHGEAKVLIRRRQAAPSWELSSMKIFWPPEMPISYLLRQSQNGMRWRSTTRPGLPGAPRAWSIITAAPI